MLPSMSPVCFNTIDHSVLSSGSKLQGTVLSGGGFSLSPAERYTNTQQQAHRSQHTQGSGSMYARARVLPRTWQSYEIQLRCACLRRWTFDLAARARGVAFCELGFRVSSARDERRGAASVSRTLATRLYGVRNATSGVKGRGVLRRRPRTCVAN